MIFLCDGLLKFGYICESEAGNQSQNGNKDGNRGEEDEDKDENEVGISGRIESIRRFLKIVSGLHLDLQVLLINRTQGFSADFIEAYDREEAFTHLAKMLNS